MKTLFKKLRTLPKDLLLLLQGVRNFIRFTVLVVPREITILKHEVEKLKDEMFQQQKEIKRLRKVISHLSSRTQSKVFIGEE